jgi:hypothetical protein
MTLVNEDHCADDHLPANEHADGSHPAHLVPRLSMFPLKHTKVLHFIRHGEGFHNVAGHANPEEYLSYEHADAHLTERGWQQAALLQQHIQGLGSAWRPQLIVVSPLTRTLETAAGVFCRRGWQNSDTEPCLMRAQEALSVSIHHFNFIATTHNSRRMACVLRR